MRRGNDMHGRVPGGWAAALVAATCVAVLVLSTPRTEAASSSTVVTVEVPTASSLDDSGCRAPGSLEAGTMLVSTWWISDACTISFGSSNGTARLRAWQRDQTAPAMESRSRTWTPRSGSTSWYAIATTSTPGLAWTSGSGGPGEPSTRLEKTTDGGTTWTTQTSCGGTPLDIEAVTDTLLYLLTGSSICRTTDGGNVWTTVFTGSGLSRLDMVDGTLGYAVGNGNRLYRTTDGLAWTQIHADAGFASLRSVSASATGRIVMGASTSALPDSTFGVVWSVDGGATFSRTTFNTSAGVDTHGVFGAFVVSDTTLLVSGPRMGTMRTTDSGATWTRVSGVAFSGEPFVRGDGAIFTPAGGDDIQRSMDGGATWTSVPLQTGQSAHIRQVAGTGLDDLWVVGYGDRRLRSTDAGTSWIGVSPAKPSWHALVAWSPQQYVAAGTGGAAVRTTDGGANLVAIPIPGTGPFHDGIALGDGVGVLIGSGRIARTADHGATWSDVAPPVAGVAWTEVAVDDAGRLWMGSSQGHVASSATGGSSWRLETQLPGAPYVSSLSAWRGVIWVGGSGGTVWRSSTAGALSWAELPTGRPGTVVGIWTVDSTTAVVLTGFETVANASHVSRTVDGGSTWTSTALAIKHVRDLATDGAHRHGFVLGSNQVVESEDRGLTWGPVWGVGVGQYIDRFAPLSGGRIVAVGDASLVSTSSPVATISDGMAGTGSGFGVCLESATGVATVQWTLAGTANCTSATLTNWTPVSSGPTGTTASIATTGTSATGTVALRFGIRTSPDQRAGSYSADLVFEAVAPAG